MNIKNLYIAYTFKRDAYKWKNGYRKQEKRVT